MADSGGATLVTAFGREFGCYPLALVAPYVLPRATQIISRRVLRDNLRLVLSDRLDIRGRRMEDASSNAAFIAEHRTDPQALRSVDRHHLLIFGRAALAAVVRRAPGIHAPVRIWRPSGDRVARSVGLRLLARRIASEDMRIQVAPGADHCLLQDPRHGASVIASVVEWIGTRAAPRGCTGSHTSTSASAR